jgi:hypothetical protein
MALSHAATVKAVAAVHLGREISVAGAYKALRGRIWSLFGTFGLIVLIVGAAVLVIGVGAGLVLAGVADRAGISNGRDFSRAPA